MKKMTVVRSVPIVSVCLAMMLGTLWFYRAEAENKATDIDSSVSVTTVIAQSKAVSQQLSFSGPVVAQRTFPVYADLPQGRIKSVSVEDGQWIKAGATLATIDTSLITIQKDMATANIQHAKAAVGQQEALLEQAKLQYLQAQSDKKRTESESKLAAVAPEFLEQRATAERIAESQVNAAKKNLEMAEADLASAQAQLAEVQLHMQQTTISAPVSGTIIELKASPGLSLAQLSDPLFVILPDDAVEVELEASGSEATRLVVGTPARIQIIGDTKIYPGKVRRGALEIKRQEQIAKVRVKFDKAPKLILGQFAQVTLTLPAKNAIYIPDKAIQFDSGSAFVFTVKDGKALKTSVKTGSRYKDLVEVLDGISAGTAVIDNFAVFLHDGEAVKVLPDNVTAQPTK